MTTKETIIRTADHLLRSNGFNAFSFKDISNQIGIKTASIHYHFPSKSDLAVATITDHIERFQHFKTKWADHSPPAQLEAFLSIYTQIYAENKVCLVGSLATDLNTLDELVKNKLKAFTEVVLDWVTNLLREGQKQKVFTFHTSPRTQALMLLTNILAIVQLARLTSGEDVQTVKETILAQLKPHNP